MAVRPGFTLEVDASECEELIDQLRQTMSGPQFEKAMFGIIQRTSRHVSKILKRDLPKSYYVKSKQIGAAVKKPQLSSGGFGGVGCTIPIRDTRGSIGGRFKASGEAKGWKIPPRGYRVKAQVVKSARTVLPERMRRIGNMKPFRNSTAKKLNMVAFAREGKDRLPIQSIQGIAIPQMPLNRSAADVQRDIAAYVQKRVEARIQGFIKNGR